MVTRRPATEKLARRIAERLVNGMEVGPAFSDGSMFAVHPKEVVRAVAGSFVRGDFDSILDGAGVSERMRRYLLDCAGRVDSLRDVTPGGDHSFAAELRRLAGGE